MVCPVVTGEFVTIFVILVYYICVHVFYDFLCYSLNGKVPWSDNPNEADAVICHIPLEIWARVAKFCQMGMLLILQPEVSILSQSQLKYDLKIKVLGFLISFLGSFGKVVIAMKYILLLIFISVLVHLSIGEANDLILEEVSQQWNTEIICISLYTS